MLKRFSLPLLFGFMTTLASTTFAGTTATESVRTSVEAIIGILKDTQTGSTGQARENTGCDYRAF